MAQDQRAVHDRWEAAVDAWADVDSSDRARRVVATFSQAFGAGMASDPLAFDRKFRKMAASPFAFYRGSACLFYADIADHADSFLDDRTSRVWIHGDLHAENFGTYMDADGQFVFNVNDFDEAYIGPFTWDLCRFVVSVALIGRAKALSDASITTLVTSYADGYAHAMAGLAEHGHDQRTLTLATADGVVLDVLQAARLRTRIALLESLTVVEGGDRRFQLGPETRALEAAESERVMEAFHDYVLTLPSATKGRPAAYRIKDVVARTGVGVGSAGLPSYNLLLEGSTQALENDVVLYVKQGQVPAVSRYIVDDEVRRYFDHEGHRTALSQRALQAHADPWLGWTVLAGRGQLVAEVSPYAADLDWTQVTDPADIGRIVEHLAGATATMHTVADSTSDETIVRFCTEDAIAEAIARDETGFRDMLVDFAHGYATRVRQDHDLFVDLFRNGRLPLAAPRWPRG